MIKGSSGQSYFSHFLGAFPFILIKLWMFWVYFLKQYILFVFVFHAVLPALCPHNFFFMCSAKTDPI